MDGGTHDWTLPADLEHLARIRRDPGGYAPGGVLHLVLEVLAYAAEEAADAGAGRCTVTLGGDGSVTVSDDGRGTQTSDPAAGCPVRKPVMSTKDLRLFDLETPRLLPDGTSRRGISVVAALSRWLVHENRRDEGAWTQRYERGVPVTGLTPVPGDGTTGTSVCFLPDAGLLALPPSLEALSDAVSAWEHLTVDVHDEREHRA